jgi:cbb3-type cytochrome oxidase cytochrome c subunit
MEPITYMERGLESMAIEHIVILIVVGLLFIVAIACVISVVKLLFKD